MAFGVTRVYYDLVARDSMSGPMGRAGASATRLEGGAARLGRALKLAGEAAGIAAVAIGYESVKAATNFEAAMTRVSTQAGASAKDVKVLSKQILALGGKVQQAPTELADAMYHLKSVGLDNVAAMKALRAASDLAAVGGAHLEETATAVAGAWRSGIKGAQNFRKAAAAVNAIIGAGNMRMQDFIDAIGTGILPSARTFGVALTSVGSALALMTDEGIPASDAATRLRMTLSLMGAPSNKAIEQLQSIGLTQSSLAKAMRSPGGLVAAVQLLHDHLHDSGLSAVQSAQVIARAFGGGRSSSAIMTLLNNVDVLRKKQDQINASMGRFGPAVEAQRKTAQAQFAMLRSTLETMAVKIGTALLPPVNHFVSFLNNTLLPGATKVAGAVAAAFRSVIPLGKIKADWHALMRAIGIEKPKPMKVTFPVTASAAMAATNPLPKVSAASLLNPAPVRASVPMNIDLLHAIKPAQAAKQVGSIFAKVDWGKVISDAIVAAANAAGQIGQAVAKLVASVNWIDVGSQVGKTIFPVAMGLINGLIDGIINTAIHHPLDMAVFILSLIPIGRAGGILAKVLGKIPFLGTFIRIIGGALEKAGGFVERILGRVLKFIFGPILKRIEPFFSGAVRWLRGAGDHIILGLWYGAEAAFRFVTRWLGKIFGWVLRPFAGAAKWLFRKGIDILSGLLRGQIQRFGDVISFVGRIGGRIIRILSSAGRWLLQTGGNMVLGFLRGIRSKMAGIGSWIKGNIVDPVVNWVKHFFGIKSPSTVFHGIGFQMIAGLFNGMMSHDIGGFVRKIFGSLPKALGHIVSKGLVSLAGLPGKALKALGGLGGAIAGLLGFGGGGSGPGGPVEAVARSMFPWPASQWPAFNYVEMREAGYRLNAQNPTSGAYGVAQFINGPGEYFQWGGNPYTAAGQFKAMFAYIRSRYGTPAAAAAHERAFNWYGGGLLGGIFNRPTLIGVGESGPEQVNVSPMSGGRDSTTDLLRALIGEVRELRRQSATAPERTGQHVGRALNGTTRRVALGRG